MFRAPVGRVNARVEQERKDPGELDTEMRRKPAIVGQGAGRLDQAIEPSEQVAPRNRHAMGRHGLRVAAVSHVQRLLQNRLHLGGEGGLRMVLIQRVTPAVQMRETGLRDRVGELAIRGPPSRTKTPA